jgi:uncharacterized DUF497 family protein
VKSLDWDVAKNVWLQQNRAICFEDILYHIESGALLDDLVHPNSHQYAHQRIFVVGVDEYVYLVPYVEADEEIFLKTIIPSRKATRKYLGGRR